MSSKGTGRGGAKLRKDGSYEPRPDTLPVAEHWTREYSDAREVCLTCEAVHWQNLHVWVSPCGIAALGRTPNCWFVKDHQQAWSTE